MATRAGEVVCESCEGHWSGHKLLQGPSSTMPKQGAHHSPVGRTKDKRKGLSSSTTVEDWQMAVVSHLLKLEDGHKRQSEASRWLSFTCHLNRPVLNQIITKAPDSAHQDTNPSLCPRKGERERERQESGTMEAISTRMA